MEVAEPAHDCDGSGSGTCHNVLLVPLDISTVQFISIYLVEEIFVFVASLWMQRPFCLTMLRIALLQY